jgi:hypothetical protein
VQKGEKIVNIKYCAFVGSIKAESIKMQAAHIGACIFMYSTQHDSKNNKFYQV